MVWKVTSKDVTYRFNFNHKSSVISDDKVTTMTLCLFCLREGPDAIRFTDEHVFPAALGGNLIVKDGSCDTCNHGNSEFEQKLAVELAPIRMMLLIPDRYGKVPSAAATFVTPAETYNGRVKSDGDMLLKRHVTQEINDKDEREFVHRFVTEKQKQKLRRDATKNGQKLIETGPGDPVIAEVHIGGELMVVGSQAGLRTAAKIAYVGLAHLVGSRIVAGDAFRKVRGFISDGKPEGVAHIFVNAGYLASNQQGPHQHSIAIAARRDKRRVDAIVRLFGELTYFVVLSDQYEGADFCQTLLYDAHRGKRDPIWFGNVQAELLQTDRIVTDTETMWNDLKSFGRNFCEFLDRVLEQERLRDRATNKKAEL